MGKNNTVNSYTGFYYHLFRNILLVSIPLAIISTLTLSIPHSSAEVSSSSSDNVSFTLSTSCTISGEIISAHHAELHGGQVVEDVGNTKLNAYCNDNNGYSIYAIGSSNNTDGNTDLISSASSNYNVHTGVYDSSTISPSTPSSWAMKLTAGVGTGPNPTVPTIENNYNTYKEVPNKYTLVDKRTSKTDMNLDTTLSGSYINTTYQIYASSIQPAGTYSGRVKYVMVHPSSNIQNFGFNEIFAVNGKTPAMVDGDKVYYAMQDMNANICSQVGLYNEASQTQLVDIRDNKLYWIAKLDDGHCWMTQNLELDLDSTTVVGSSDALTSKNTNLKTYGSNGYDSNNGYSCSNTQTTTNCTASGEIITWVPTRTTVTTLTTGENSNFPNTTAANSTSYSYNPGDRYYYPTSATGDTSYTLAECESHNYTDCAHYKAGNYYNWSASVASNNTSYTGNNTDAGNSVCPKGWRLPKKSANEYQSLVDAYGITASNALNLRNAPLYFVRSGYVRGGSLSGVSGGRYWSSTVDSANASTAYSLRFGSDSLYPAGNDGRYLGFPVRCVAE